MKSRRQRNVTVVVLRMIQGKMYNCHRQDIHRFVLSRDLGIIIFFFVLYNFLKT